MAEKYDAERHILKAACSEYGVAPELVDELISVIAHEGHLRRSRIRMNLQSVIENHAQEQVNDHS